MQSAAMDKLTRDLRVVLDDAEELLKATAGQTGEKVQQLRARTEESLRGVRSRLESAGRDADRFARDAAADLDARMSGNPWAVACVAAGLGVVVGILLGRR
jgi:ElaB/YqjD/DUF883 family membrane-anchored ribosome-binding protein